MIDESTPDWVQLTYTSADPARGTLGGGWGIKETSPGASEAEIRRLREGVTTRLKEVNETSVFASESQLMERPRRLSHLEVDGLTTMWHAASAGPDATGRPGNVFTHGATLRKSVPGLRPIEYWRAEGWLAPFRANAVAAARLGTLRPGESVTRESVTSFVREGECLYALEWLLAAVSHVVASGSTMVLVTNSTDEAAQWLGAFSYLTAPAGARRISWVTYERADGVPVAAARGFVIVCVPREDLPSLLEAAYPGVVVADPTWMLDDPKDGHWVTKAGQKFPADVPWQNAALDVLALAPAHCLQVLHGIDEVAGGLLAEEAEALPLSWALSMALLADGQAVVANRDEVLLDCLKRAPRSALSTSSGERLVEELRSRLDAETRGRLGEGPGADSALQNALELGEATRYLEGGWREGGTPPDVSPRLAAQLRRDYGSGVVDAVRAAETAAGQSRDILPVAQLVTFVLENELDPIPETDETPSLMAPVVSLLRDRLVEMHRDPGDAVAVRLHTSLVDGTSPLPSGSPEIGRAVAKSELAARSTVRALDPQGVIREPSPAHAAGAAERIGELLLKSTPGSERACVIAECLLVARERTFPALTPEDVSGDAQLGLAAGNLLLATYPRRDRPTLHEEMRLATTLWRSPSTPGSLQGKLAGWLAVYWANSEVESRGQTFLSSPPPDLLSAARDYPEPFVAALASFVRDAPVASAAAFVVKAVESQIMKPQESLLGEATHGLSRLGWAAVQRAALLMPSDSLRTVLNSAEPGLIELVGRLGDKVVDLVKEIDPPSGNPAAQAGSELDPANARTQRLQRRR